MGYILGAVHGFVGLVGYFILKLNFLDIDLLFVILRAFGEIFFFLYGMDLDFFKFVEISHSFSVTV